MATLPAPGRVWHGFADMHQVSAGPELHLVRGEASTVWDVDGRAYLDATAGLWFANVGHGRTRIAGAVGRQLGQLAAYSSFGDMGSPALDQLADRLATLAPISQPRIFFTSGGSDSVDTAVKLVRRRWDLLASPERRIVLVRERAYHGMHAAGTSLAGIADNRRGYGPLDPDVAVAPWDDVDGVRAVIGRIGPSRIAALFCEPVIGAGGVLFPGAEYLHDVRALCREHEILFVADEVITGFGRTGAWFASARFDLDPDVILCAKGLTSGYVPMGAVIAAEPVWQPFWAPGAGVWRHGYTYGGHAGAVAAALENLAILQEEDLSGRARQLEPVLAGVLTPLAGLAAVAEVRAGPGLLAAVQLTHPEQAPDAVLAARRHGVLTRALAGGALQVSPPLVITTAELDRLADGLRHALLEIE